MTIGKLGIIFLAGLLFPLLTPVIGNAAGQGGIGLAPGVVDPSNPASNSFFIFHLSVNPPNNSTQSFVKVNNTTNAPIDVYINAVDGTTATSSGAVYANRQDPVTKAGQWITPLTSQNDSTPLTRITIPVGQSQIYFNIAVPASATPGDHLAGIALEPINTNTSNGQVQVTTVIRNVIGVLIRVDEASAQPFKVALAGQLPTIPSAKIEALPGTGTASVVVPIENVGQLLGKPKLSVTLSGANGYQKSVSKLLDTLLPGEIIAYPYPWPDRLDPGTYTITATASWVDTSGQTQNTDPSTQAATINSSLAAFVPNQVPSTPQPASGLLSSPLGWVFLTFMALLAITVVLMIWFLLIAPRRQLSPHLDESSRKEILDRLKTL